MVLEQNQTPDAIMVTPYPIIDVSTWPINQTEQMGTKGGLWCINPNDGRRWLFKMARSSSEPGKFAGEDWAEKLAAEIAGYLGLPHARIELANREGKPGIISLNFVVDPSCHQLEHGNELMYRRFQEAYPKTQKRRVFLHTVRNVLSVLSEPFIHPPSEANFPEGVETASDAFLGYLLLDALIGNTDRHHENWAILEHRHSDQDRYAELSPTYDHASSLGRELTDEARAMGLSGERRSLSPMGYSARARSAFYEHERDAKPVSPIRAFQIGFALRQVAGYTWRNCLARLQERSFGDIVEAIPTNRMSETAREFALQLLKYNKQGILNAES